MTRNFENPLKDDLDHVLNHTKELWEKVRNKRIFITGGTGFFGCWLLESFAWANKKLDLNAEMLVLTRDYERFKKKAPHLATNPKIRFHIGDVRTFNFPEGKYDYIIHAATESSAKLNTENPLLMFDTIVEGTRHTLDFAKYCSASKFLLTSSGAVYGKQPPEMTHIPEDYIGAPDTMNPHSAYGEGKRVSELLCAINSKQYGIECKIARCFAFVGPYLPLDAHYAIGNFIRDGLQGGPIEVKGDGTPYRSYLYAADLAIWLWTILFRGESGYPYNVGSSREIAIGFLANAIATLLLPAVEVYFTKAPVPRRSVERYIPSTQRVHSELGLQQHIQLKEAVTKTIQYYQLNK